MNKAEFIEVLSTHFDGNKAEAARALNAVTQTITYQTAGGEKVTITGFGVFEKVHRSARMVRNPRTGERKRAKATAIPRFRAGTDLKAYVAGTKKVPKAAKKTASKTAASAAATAVKAPATKTAVATKKTATKAPATKAPATKTATTKAAAAKTTTAAKKATPAKTATAAKKTTAKKATAKR